MLDLAEKYICNHDNSETCLIMESEPLKVRCFLDLIFLYYFEQTGRKSEAIVRSNEILLSMMRLQDRFEKYSIAAVFVEIS